MNESINVESELKTAAQHIRSISGSGIEIHTKELGNINLARLYSSLNQPIEVQCDVPYPSDQVLDASGPNWRAEVIKIPGAWLHNLYEEHGDSLFSANYRDFLGLTGRSKRVNGQIAATAQNDPEDFWVFNNGITLLTRQIKEDRGKKFLCGVSIINGAQTTGAIGSLAKGSPALEKISLMGRVVVSQDTVKTEQIVKYNNTQNEIKSWDTYSNKPEQLKLVEEFKELDQVYMCRRNADSSTDVYGIEQVSQPLLAFRGHWLDANRGTNNIFDRKDYYERAFAGARAGHVLLAYALALSFDRRKIELKNKSSNDTILDDEEEQLNKLRNIKFKNFFLSVVSRCMQAVLNTRVDAATVSFKPDAVRGKSKSELASHWDGVAQFLLRYTCLRTDNDVTEDLRKSDILKKVSDQVSVDISVVRSDQEAFSRFSSLVLART